MVIGPEAPLVAGVADVVRDAGIDCFGPGAAGARVEGSKDFSKRLMMKYDLPTAAYGTFTDCDSALAYLNEQGAPIVVKADGLAAGKGVTVALTKEEADEAICECFDGRFGEAGSTVVLEEMMTGPECSMLAFTDGVTMIPMAPSQDHKRAYENDEGPNTGGMGVYSPVPIVTDEEHATMVDIMERAVAGLREEGIDYRGVLYGGFMLTPQGPKLLEFNARFGDPETQVVLPRLETDLVDVMVATAQRRLSEIELSWRPEWASCSQARAILAITQRASRLPASTRPTRCRAFTFTMPAPRSRTVRSTPTEVVSSTSPRSGAPSSKPAIALTRHATSSIGMASSCGATSAPVP